MKLTFILLVPVTGEAKEMEQEEWEVGKCRNMTGMKEVKGNKMEKGKTTATYRRQSVLRIMKGMGKYDHN